MKLVAAIERLERVTTTRADTAALPEAAPSATPAHHDGQPHETR